jgi:hypothetical protein
MPLDASKARQMADNEPRDRQTWSVTDKDGTVLFMNADGRLGIKIGDITCLYSLAEWHKLALADVIRLPAHDTRNIAQAIGFDHPTRLIRFEDPDRVDSDCG